jgi:hypothetical protein
MGCSGGLLSAPHGLLDQPYDHHKDSSAYTAGSDLADNRADIKAPASSHIYLVGPCRAIILSLISL